MSLNFLDFLKLDSLTMPYMLRPLMSSDFGTGVLAVVVASPCTAPFMGAALGLTLVIPPGQGLLIFLFLGLGLALPVPVLAHWPRLIKALPKSGPWMVTLKKLMAVPMLGTCLWLGWVLNSQLTNQERSDNWAAYEKKLIVEERKRRPVFIDFTASWCITCQVNKQRVLDTEEIQSLFKSNNVFLVRADWTNYNSGVTKALAEYQRNSVPLYVFYDGSIGEAVILPELLAKDDIRKLFNREVQK